MNNELMNDAIKQQAEAWMAVYMELLKGNPEFPASEKNGMDSALTEIRRLQAAAASKDKVLESLGKDVAARIVELEVRSVYGKNLVYPSNETAQKFADLLGVKSFNKQQIEDIKALGYFLALSTKSVVL